MIIWDREENLTELQHIVRRTKSDLEFLMLDLMPEPQSQADKQAREQKRHTYIRYQFKEFEIDIGVVGILRDTLDSNSSARVEHRTLLARTESLCNYGL
jgi:hypothetical protein